jgi:3-oxoacyl-[acyl-carrier protein] reductase
MRIIMTDLDGKNCFITGAAKGIGRALAIGLAKEGMNLFITDIDMDSLGKVKNEIENLGVIVYAEKCDVSQFSDFEKIAPNFYYTLGNLDLLVNNAGISVMGSLIDISLEDWRKIIDVNLWGVIYALKVFLPHMLEKKSGHIVNMASGSGIFGSSDPLPYITSKFGVVGISEALYGRLKNSGIKVSVMTPSYIRTDIFTKSKSVYPPQLIKDIGPEKVEEIHNSIVLEVSSKAKLPERAVKKFIAGIRKEQLYLTDIGGIYGVLAQKGTDPQKFEEFLVTYYENFHDIGRKYFLKHGINIDDYTYYVY